MKNTGKKYETLVEKVFSELLKQDSVENIGIEKNKILQGKSTTHEIDVYWEFKIGGITYSTIIQAKDWKSKVPQGEILKLKAILEDLPGQPRGIFVTKTGYQSGSVETAKSNGIILYELREPTDADWNGRIKTIHLNLQAYIPKTEVKIIEDVQWAKNELKKLSLESIEISMVERNDKIKLYDENGNEWKSILQLEDEEQAKLGMTVVKDKKVIIEMEESRFIKTNNSEFPLMKIKALEFTLSTSLHKEEIIIDSGTMVGYILKNILNGEETIFDKSIRLNS